MPSSICNYPQAIESYDKQFNWITRLGTARNNTFVNSVPIESFNKTVQYQPDYYKAWYNRGWSLHQLQRYEETIESMTKQFKLKEITISSLV